MSDDWILNEEEEWNAEEPSPRDPATSALPPDALVGQDDACTVSVHVDREARVLAVTLAEDWRRSVDPRSLHAHVLAAANAATMQALAAKVEEVDPTAPAQAPTPRTDSQDDTRITPGDAMRLLDEVSADLARFTEQMSSVVDQIARAESAGGYVNGSGQRGQILEIAIDTAWASSSRRSEIETELLSFLTTLAERSSPRESAQGPQSRAISELMALASDPQTLMRRVGLTS